MDISFRRAIITVRGDLGEFFLDLLVNPISLVLTAAVVALLIGQTPMWKRYAAGRRAKKEAAAG
jgi:putative tricarboxylic transport membrane protein